MPKVTQHASVRAFQMLPARPLSGHSSVSLSCWVSSLSWALQPAGAG